MITVEMTWNEFRTLVYGMYIRDFYDYGGNLDGMEPVCYAEFLDNEYLDEDGMRFLFNNDDREWTGWLEIYLDDPMIKEVEE